MILRDYLAIDRTLLANETSFMSYVRTSLTLIAAGATLIKFFDSEYMQALGWGFVAVGGWLSVHGYNRYRQVDAIMHKVKGDEADNNEESALPIETKNWAARVWRRNS